MKISIHVPRAGYDPGALSDKGIEKIFLSTYPVRGTTARPGVDVESRDISIHVPRAGYDRQRRH